MSKQTRQTAAPSSSAGPAPGVSPRVRRGPIIQLLQGDSRQIMTAQPETHFHCCVTSPPYFGLRDYQAEGQIGLEAGPDEYVQALRGVFGAKDNPVGVWRVLRDDGVLWLNLGDSYNSGGGYSPDSPSNRTSLTSQRGQRTNTKTSKGGSPHYRGWKHKDLLGIPWRVAFALQADGWYLRDAIFWHKPAPMPGSQRDRCTSAYELIFQLTKRPRYFFNLEAVKEPAQDWGLRDRENWRGKVSTPGNPQMGCTDANHAASGRTPRNVWTMAHDGYKGPHFATFPVELPLRCIKASTSEKGCCPICGAAWLRIIKRERKATRPGKDNVSDETGKANRDEKRHVTETRTAGWKPGCRCNMAYPEMGLSLDDPAFVAHKPIRCRVLDPFSGVGTTGVACAQLGVDYTGIELNPDYNALAEDRIGAALHPGTYVPKHTSETAPLFAEAT